MKQKESVSAAARTYTVLLQPELGGGYTVTCPTLPGLVTYGGTLAEARAMAVDAISGYLECLREDGEPIPESDPAAAPLVDRVSVQPPDDGSAAAGDDSWRYTMLSGRTASRLRMKAWRASSIAGSSAGGS
jgi:antitoxin HicB